MIFLLGLLPIQIGITSFTHSHFTLFVSLFERKLDIEENAFSSSSNAPLFSQQLKILFAFGIVQFTWCFILLHVSKGESYFTL